MSTSRRKPRLNFLPVAVSPSEMSAEELIDVIEREMKLVERYERDLQSEATPPGQATSSQRASPTDRRLRDAA